MFQKHSNNQVTLYYISINQGDTNALIGSVEKL